MKWQCCSGLPAGTVEVTWYGPLHASLVSLLTSACTRNYIACNLGAVFTAAGFTCDRKYLASATKTLSFHKPERDEGGAGVGEAPTPGSAAEEVLSAAAAGVAAEATLKEYAELN